jgi:hypothetical protein
MLLGHPWLKHAKVSHNYGTDIVIVQGTCIIRAIHVTKKLSVQTKRPKILVCYDFHSGIFDEEMDMMFSTELDLFSNFNRDHNRVQA